MKDRYEEVVQQLENEKNRYSQLKKEMDQREERDQETSDHHQQAIELANKEKKVVELNETLRLADRKNKILLELIEYQKGPIDKEVDDLL